MLKGFIDIKFAIFDFKKYSNDKKVVIWGVGAMLHVTAYCLEELQIPLYAYANVEGFSQALFYNVISLAELVDICEKEEIFILWGIEGKSIILYGAGGVGKAYYSHIVRDMECVLEAWVDKNAKYLKEMELLPVQEVECIRELEYDYIIVAVKEEKLYIQIKEELIKNEGVLEEKIIWNKTKEE